MEALRNIRPASGPVDAEITLPPSKSLTNRALIAAALADGQSILLRPSTSDDSRYLLDALAKFGVTAAESPEAFRVDGTAGALKAPSSPIFVGNAGTAMRFLSGIAALAPAPVVLDGDEQMRKRPIQDLLDALRRAGVRSESTGGCPPVTLHGGTFAGGTIEIDASKSSQYLSALLLAAPYAKRPVTIQCRGTVSSLPYVDMSIHVMRSFGAQVENFDSRVFKISNTDRYVGRSFAIEADASAASYFFAAAAVTRGHVSVPNLSPDSLQGDIRFLDLLEQAGCRVVRSDNTIEVFGSKLYGIEADMNSIPDCVPTLAVIAAFAEGPTTITNVAHLRHKETDRLSALTRELAKIGARAEVVDDTIEIHPGTLRGAVIETYNDHRMAMSFAVAGLAIPGIKIQNPGCVSKSFPDFWEEFSKFEPRSA